jgi:hypothetical protein
MYFQEGVSRRNEAPATLLSRLGADEGDAEAILHSPRTMRPFRLLVPGTPVRAKVDDAGRLRSPGISATGHGALARPRRRGQTEQQVAEAPRRNEIGEIKPLFAATDAAGSPTQSRSNSQISSAATSIFIEIFDAVTVSR